MLTVNFHTTEDTSLTLCTSDRQDLNLAAGAVLKEIVRQSWASEGLFPGVRKDFWRGVKMVKFHFAHSKQKITALC